MERRQAEGIVRPIQTTAESFLIDAHEMSIPVGVRSSLRAPSVDRWVSAHLSRSG